MLRSSSSFKQLQALLKDGLRTATSDAANQSPTGAHASWHEHSFVARALKGIFSSQPAANVMQLPMHLEAFQTVLRKNAGEKAGLLGRLFSSGNKPRGFENFSPRSAPSSKVNKATPKAEGRKAAEKAAEGAGGGGGGAGGDKGDPENMTSITVNINPLWIIAGLGALWLLTNGGGQSTAAGGPKREISFQEFHTGLLAKRVVSRLEIVNNSVVRVYIRPDAMITDSLPSSPADGVYKFYFQIGSVDAFERKLDEAQRGLGLAPDGYVPVKYVHEFSWASAALEVLPTLLLLGATFWLINRQMGSMMGGMGGGPMTGRGGKQAGKGGMGGLFGMSRANVTTLDKAAKEKLSFKDVAGCDEAKVEIMEFVDFLKKPDKYRDLGAKIPKGALLVGPPGTGKTLLAKATAGEAGVPFLSISGSDFMEMFVGVGPARVRDLFAQARSQSPSMIFIDEIDAIGRARGRGGAMGGHDERENTLNQLLVEMDGFATTSGVVVLAGTNRPDILDKALLRPGRFDRMITVDTPDINGRTQIFKVHLSKLRLAKEVDYYAERLAALTPGMSGADIANVCNEAALVAARHDKVAVDMPDFEAAIDRVIGGLEKKNKVISKEERRTVAFHESGHAVVSWFLEYAEPLLKVSIVPRGTSVLGFAQYLPNENLLMTKEQLLDRLCALLGGRAAEQVLLGKISTGAVNDLERVTQMAYSQVAVYGMNDKVGMLSYRMDREQFDKPYSNETAHLIDTEVRAFVDQAYQRTIGIVEKYKDLITDMSNELLRKEVLNLEDVEKILGKRAWMPQEIRNIDRYRHGASGVAPPATPAASGDRLAGDEGDSEGVNSGPPKEGGGPQSGSGGGGGGDSGDKDAAPAGKQDGSETKPGKTKRRVPPGVVVATCEGGADAPAAGDASGRQ